MPAAAGVAWPNEAITIETARVGVVDRSRRSTCSGGQPWAHVMSTAASSDWRVPAVYVAASTVRVAAEVPYRHQGEPP